MKYAIFFCFFMTSLQTHAQDFLPLYADSVPNSIAGPDRERSETTDGIQRISKVSVPGMYTYFPARETATGEAVIIYPGGGYGILAIGHEGHDVAKLLNQAGIAAFVVKYRLPDDSIMIDKKIGPLQDAQRAIQMVRENATRWNITTSKIGIMGFSAGGHLASTAGTHFDKAYISNPNRTPLRPDFMILVYPVISFNDSIVHRGSRNNLIGIKADEKTVNEFSNELHVTARTPRTFLVHAKDDKGVPYTNSTVFEAALKKNKVPVRLYLYDAGGHGFGLNNKTSEIKWLDLVIQWIHTK
jgi:acetyl esterase/lipase